MKKYFCDRVSVILLAIGIIVLPILQGQDRANNLFLTSVVCGSTIFLILLTKIIGYKTGYTPDEIKKDRVNFIILSSFLALSLIMDGVLWIRGI